MEPCRGAHSLTPLCGQPGRGSHSPLEASGGGAAEQVPGRPRGAGPGQGSTFAHRGQEAFLQGLPRCLFASQLNCSQGRAFVSQHISYQAFSANMSVSARTHAPRPRGRPTPPCAAFPSSEFPEWPSWSRRKERLKETHLSTGEQGGGLRRGRVPGAPRPTWRGSPRASRLP